MSNQALMFPENFSEDEDHKELVVLITGSNQGIGYACVQHFAREGATVIGTARSDESCSRAKDNLKEMNLDVDYQVLDISLAESVEELAEYVGERYGRLDILVNNAGIFVGRPMGQSSLEESTETIQNVFNVNTLGTLTSTLIADNTGTLRCMQAFVPLMRENNFGRIVNITSALGKLENQSGTSSISYCISKSSIHVITKIVVDMIESENPSPNITINCLRPGFVRTQMHANTPEDIPARLGTRWHTHEEVAREIYLLACTKGREVTGKLFYEGNEEKW